MTWMTRITGITEITNMTEVTGMTGIARMTAMTRLQGCTFFKTKKFNDFQGHISNFQGFQSEL